MATLVGEQILSAISGGASSWVTAGTDNRGTVAVAVSEARGPRSQAESVAIHGVPASARPSAPPTLTRSRRRSTGAVAM